MAISNKCKNCGGELLFDVDSQALRCTHCSSIVDFDEERKPITKKLLTPESTITESKTKYTQYSCPTCGRKHISPTDTLLTRCPSCGDNQLTKTIDVDYTPDGLIPFKINKENAIQYFSAWIKTRKFAPNALKNLAKMKVLDGFYLPAYYYDFDTVTNFSGIGVNTYTDGKGNTHETRERFNKTRKDNYKNRAESASSLITSPKLKQLGTFPQEKICVYKTEYLYGWFGSSVTSPLQDNSKNMKMCVSQELASSARASLHYDHIERFSCSTTFSDIFYSYVYLPVWKGFYKYKNKDYSYYINGETGKVTGKAPKSFWKIFFTVLGVLAVVGGIAYLVAKYC